MSRSAENKKGRLTQRLVNSYPSWSDIRLDQESVGFQYLNPIGLLFDDLSKELKRATASYSLSTTPVNEIGLLSKFQLPRTFTFVKADNDDTELNYQAPTVSGLDEMNIYREVTLADNNDMFGFWRDAVPDRLSLVQTNYYMEGWNGIIGSGYVYETPLAILPVSGQIDEINHLTITMSGGSNYFGLENNKVYRGLVQIEGEARNGSCGVEELVFLHDDKEKTINDYLSVSGIRAYGVNPDDTTFVTVANFDFNNGPYRSAYPLDYDPGTGENIPSFWDIGREIGAGKSTLDFILYQQPELNIRLAGFVDRYPDQSMELRNTAGDPIVAVDLAVEPYSDHLWIVDNDTLYCFRSDLPYLNLTKRRGKTENPACVIRTSSDIIYPGESLEVDYYWRDPSKGLMKHRVSVEYPDDTKYTDIGGTLTVWTPASSYWVTGEPHTRYLRDQETFTFTTEGQYTFTLEVMYPDESTDTDKRIVRVMTLQPVGEYPLYPNFIPITDTVIGVDIDSENYIWVKVLQDGNTIKLVKLGRHYDIMLIDFERKVLYFREQYSEVVIKEDD